MAIYSFALAAVLFFGSFLAVPRFLGLSQEKPVCEVLAPIKLEPAVAAPMASVQINSKITNCTPLSKTYRVIGVEIAECGQSLVFGDGDVTLEPGASFVLSAEGVGAPDTCIKPVKVAIAAYDGQTQVAKVEATLQPKQVAASQQ